MVSKTLYYKNHSTAQKLQLDETICNIQENLVKSKLFSVTLELILILLRKNICKTICILAPVELLPREALKTEYLLISVCSHTKEKA